VVRRLLGAAVKARVAPPIILEKVTLGYDGSVALRQVCGEIPTGDMLALVGPNGGGKSTLLKALAGLLAPMAGRISRGGLEPGDVAYLPQATEIDRSFPIRVRDFVALGALRRCGLFARFAGEDARVASAIAAVGLAGCETRTLDALSGGQMQRALFARLVVEDRDVILLDEPFGAIDAATTNDLLDLVARWRAEGRTIVAALHEFDIVRRAFPRALLLAGRALAWGETAETLSAQNLDAARAIAAQDTERRADAL
jgi:zinc/manganese transport system ATP-binding protein